MSRGRSLKAIAAGALVSLALAACGGSGGSGNGPSALDPANMVPSSSVLYMSVTVRPQGSVRHDLIAAVDSVAGKGTAQRLVARLDKSLGKRLGQFTDWVGQRVGVAITNWPANIATASQDQEVEDDLLVVAPTSNPAAARKFLADKLRNPPAGVTGKVVGDYVIFGGANAVGQALATTAKTSLAAARQFKADTAQLGNASLFNVYFDLHQFLEAILPAEQATDRLSSPELQRALKEVPPGATVTLGLSALPHQFRLDVVEHGLHTPSRGGSSVPLSELGSLPSASWLALALNSYTKQSLVNQAVSGLTQTLAQFQTAGRPLNGVPNGPLHFVEADLLPALGPLSLSVSGTTQHTVHAGLIMRPVNRSAGARLANSLKQLVAGLPISTQSLGGQLLVTFGYKNAQQLLHPSSTLADDPTFKNAVSQLPAGATADAYMAFGPIAMFASLDHNAKDAAVWRALKRLRYLIAGSSHGHFRLVLATG